MAHAIFRVYCCVPCRLSLDGEVGLTGHGSNWMSLIMKIIEVARHVRFLRETLPMDVISEATMGSAMLEIKSLTNRLHAKGR